MQVLALATSNAMKGGRARGGSDAGAAAAVGDSLQRNCPLVLPPHGDKRRLEAEVFVEADAAEALGDLAVRAALYRCNDEGEVDAAGGCLRSMLWCFLSLDALMVTLPSPSPSAPPCLL